MNESQALAIVTWLNRAGLLWAMENQAEVWADALGDIHPETGLLAAKEIARTRTSDQRAITPGDVRKHVETIRVRRLQGVETGHPPSELADRPKDHARWLKLRNWQIGNGLTPELADAYADAQYKITRKPAIKGRPPTFVTKGIPE